MSSPDKGAFRSTYLKISLPALKKNFEWLQSQSSEFLCPMVKANAYGHGDLKLVQKMESWGCQHFGVGLVEEGLGLRAGGVLSSILVFGFRGREATEELIEKKLTPVVSSMEQLEDLVQVAKQPLEIHIKFNTGMNRRGFQQAECAKVLQILQNNPKFIVKGLCTHLLNGGDLSNGSHSESQVQTFETMTQGFQKKDVFFHIYNSSGLASVRRQQKSVDYGCRPGLLAYGINPINDQGLTPLISPVMEFHSNIVSTQRVKSGDVVSYDGIWSAKRESVIGILPAGYADGVCRSLSNCGHVLVRGYRVPIVGRVCMDYVMVDLTDLKVPPSNLLGEGAVFFGRQGSETIGVEEVAKTADRVSYEILTGISERVPRLYLE